MPHATLSLRKVQALLGLPAGVVAGLIASGVVTPTRGPHNAWRFTFQDVVTLRTAHRLRTAQVPTGRLMRALARLRQELPDSTSLSEVRLAAVGRDVVVQDGGMQWEAASGQLLMDFEPPPPGAEVQAWPRARPDWFSQASALETSDPAAAEQAYRRAIDEDLDHAAAYLNLSALLCDLGRGGEAAALLAEAVQRMPDDPELHFNHGIALEDLRRFDDAVVAYDQAVLLQPDLADAHFNLARLHELAGRPHRAMRHLQEYRRLTR